MMSVSAKIVLNHKFMLPTFWVILSVIKFVGKVYAIYGFPIFTVPYYWGDGPNLLLSWNPLYWGATRSAIGTMPCFNCKME